jgi:RNA polymerase sigma-70 factor (ECF subfamily)
MLSAFFTVFPTTGDVLATNFTITNLTSGTSIARYIWDPGVRDTSNDIFQDTFIKVIDKLHQGKYNEEGKFLPWVLRIAHNLCMDYYRKNQRQGIVSNNNPEFDIMDALEDHEALVDFGVQEEESINILKYVDLLPEEQREVIILRHYYDYSFKEIAEMTGTNINTALGRMRYALINLRKLIKI